MNETTSDDLWVLSFTVDDSHPHWETRQTVVGTREQLAKLFDLSRLPPGARLLKGAEARQYLVTAFREERKYQREQLTKRRAGGSN